ncbi:homeobox-leucine zipper protein HOX11-like [Abrus precatorius]|uniref:Homeobox-leucine zipper protein HOX11-like n=1 Tax=Abrus precatorius TaxID=3816 RepID=A0A8B8LB06_ABRPR|nr:homeobox-leucine zipper protein HOX11-like [Abrus precatorius]
MELALSLGDTPKPFSLATKLPSIALEDERKGSSDPPLQLHLLPSTPVPPSQPSSHFPIPWLMHALSTERATSEVPTRVLDVNRFQSPPVDDTDDGAALSSPNSAVSSFPMDFCIRNSNADAARNTEGADRTSDDEENGSTRKKLRLSKEQSAFLEDSFKEHTTLNPKQKLALAKQLNLRPRQVEVWFQNRRARTKLKQTEVDCEYLKRCCESLTEENRRLQKELQELRALKTSQPFYMQLPATTLTMCPSCERVATNNNNASRIPATLCHTKPRILPLSNAQAQPQEAQMAHQIAS